MKNIIVSFAAILLFSASAFSQIEGRVTDTKGNGIPNAYVQASASPTGIIASVAKTDADGHYRMNNLALGRLTLYQESPAASQLSSRADR
ncbi:MAG: Carboxypeptidase regulatory-like domain [Acidobacteriota bacterium]|jgi:protocatechuate 3,4-dioxygenase beta subunit|nr:Carboxypeptidase regulatory-like domain [Acidobacteriota bacterium]